MQAAKLGTNPDPFSTPSLFAVELSDTNYRVSYLEATISQLFNELEVEMVKSKNSGRSFSSANVLQNSWQTTLWKMPFPMRMSARNHSY